MAANSSAPRFKVATINESTGSLSNAPASLSDYNSTSNYCLYVTTSGSASNTPKGHLKAEKVWNAVWNDYADFQLLNDELIPGKCYFDTADGAKICDTRCQLSVIGIASDTFATAVGTRDDIPQVPIAVAGWALAYVDKEYPCGTPLTNNENGELTEMTLEEKRDYPERLVAIYKRQEMQEEFGTESSKIKVDGRHWVKVK
jgi:hypothetical protein